MLPCSFGVHVIERYGQDIDGFTPLTYALSVARRCFLK